MQEILQILPMSIHENQVLPTTLLCNINKVSSTTPSMQNCARTPTHQPYPRQLIHVWAIIVYTHLCPLLPSISTYGLTHLVLHNFITIIRLNCEILSFLKCTICPKSLAETIFSLYQKFDYATF